MIGDLRAKKKAAEVGFLIPHAAWQLNSGEPGAWRTSKSPGAGTLTSGSLRNRAVATDGARAKRVKKCIFAEVSRTKIWVFEWLGYVDMV